MTEYKETMGLTRLSSNCPSKLRSRSQPAEPMDGCDEASKGRDASFNAALFNFLNINWFSCIFVVTIDYSLLVIKDSLARLNTERKNCFHAPLLTGFAVQYMIQD